tara:strand:+ start:1102 stop:1509 length:408 start_codon:yes stop_codon:yes gene_type:complete
MIKEFKEFALKGNMIDMAVGIIIGAAFSKIVSSLVDDIIMPPLGLLMGKVDFSNYHLVLQQKTTEHPAVSINYGQFLTATLDFIILAFVIFIVIKQINKLKKQDKKPKINMQSCPRCLSEIHKNATKCPMCTSEI